MKSRQGIILYAKHWFAEEDLIEDLRALWEIEHYYCSNHDTIQLSMGMMGEFLKDNPELFVDFISGSSPNEWPNEWITSHRADTYIKQYQKGSYWHNVLSKFLSILSISDVKKLEKTFGELGEPDYDILPQSKYIEIVSDIKI